MFKITIEGSGDQARVTSEVRKENFGSICYALSRAILSISRMGDVSVSELFLLIQAITDTETKKDRKDEHPDE